jgi:hypothetical protein
MSTRIESAIVPSGSDVMFRGSKPEFISQPTIPDESSEWSFFKYLYRFQDFYWALMHITICKLAEKGWEFAKWCEIWLNRKYFDFKFVYSDGERIDISQFIQSQPKVTIWLILGKKICESMSFAQTITSCKLSEYRKLTGKLKINRISETLKRYSSTFTKLWFWPSISPELNLFLCLEISP